MPDLLVPLALQTRNSQSSQGTPDLSSVPHLLSLPREAEAEKETRSGGEWEAEGGVKPFASHPRMSAHHWAIARNEWAARWGEESVETVETRETVETEETMEVSEQCSSLESARETEEFSENRREDLIENRSESVEFCDGRDFAEEEEVKSLERSSDLAVSLVSGEWSSEYSSLSMNDGGSVDSLEVNTSIHLMDSMDSMDSMDCFMGDPTNLPSHNHPSLNSNYLNNPSLNHPSLNHPSLNHPSLNHPSLNHPSINESSMNESSIHHPSLRHAHGFRSSVELVGVSSPHIYASSDDAKLPESSPPWVGPSSSAEDVENPTFLHARPSSQQNLYMLIRNAEESKPLSWGQKFFNCIHSLKERLRGYCRARENRNNDNRVRNNELEFPVL